MFWLDPDRGHDAQIIQKVNAYLAEQDVSGLEIKIMKPVDAMKFSLERIRRGEDTISVTGNVLRDYLTDLFPILELGTSARMLSIVPLLRGGELFETGAGGSAPKHVHQFVKEGHLRWDSLGEYCALGALAGVDGDKNRQPARGAAFENAGRGHRPVPRRRPLPSRKVNEIDKLRLDILSRVGVGKGTRRPGRRRGVEATLTCSAALAANESAITQELLAAQGKPVDIGGTISDDAKCAVAMRPSATLNAIIDRM